MSKKLKKNLKRIIISLILFLITFTSNIILKEAFNFENGLSSIIKIDKFGFILPFSIYFLIYIYIGHDVLRKSFLNIKNGSIFDENLLMTIATIGAFSLGIYTGIKYNSPDGFDEACAVLLFYQIGEWFQSFAVNRSRKSIKELMDIRPDYANLITCDGEMVVDPLDLKIDDLIIVKPGEKIPVDGVIVKGISSLDTKSLTGEALVREVMENDYVISGSINLSGNILVKVLKEFNDSTVSKILDLVSNASDKKSKSENFITVFSKFYTPIVVILALILAFIPPIICGIFNISISGFMGFETFNLFIYRALSFLVVSCPCALVISIPLSFFAGLGGASRNGILVKGSNYLELFEKCNIFVFDKTGTLTKGNFKVGEIYPKEKHDEILKYAYIAEQHSNHPIAKSIKSEYKGNESFDYDIIDYPGFGVKAYKDEEILCGNEKLMDKFNIKFDHINLPGTIIHVAVDKKYLGYILIHDEIKEDSFELINYLNKKSKTIMLSGDNDLIAEDVAKKLNLSDFRASLLPQDKVYELEKILSNKKKNDYVCYIGDGINDAPVLMRSDIGISMGQLGSDAAIEASDIVLMHDDLKSIIKLKKISQKTKKLVYENIIFAIGVKVIILVLATLGIANMWVAVFGDVGVSVIAILNAMRANKKIK